MKRLIAALLLLVASACGQSIIQSASGNNGAGATTVAATWGSATVAGRAILAGVAINVSASQTVLSCADSNGNTYVTIGTQPIQGAATVRTALFYVKNVAGGSGTVTCTLSASRQAAIRIWEVSGLDTSEEPDVSVVSGTGTATVNQTCGTSGTTNIANDFVVGVSGVNSAPTFTAGAGFTLEGQNSNGAVATVAMESKTVAAIGTQSATLTTNVNSTYACITAVFKRATVGVLQTSGPLSAGTGADDATVGTVAWTTPGNITTSNNSYAVNGSTGTGTVTAHYLKATNFGFAIPAGVTVVGIKVEVEQHIDGTDPGGCDSATFSNVKYVQGGVIAGNSQAGGVTFSVVVDAYKSFGGQNNTWGLTITAANVNDATSGVVMSALMLTNVVCGGGAVDVYVDHIRMTAYYTAAAGSQPYRQPGMIFSQTREAKTVEAIQ
jgi:hypothetical protein